MNVHPINPLVLIGTPYAPLGADPLEGFDCFGLVQYVRRTCFGLATPIEGSPREPEMTILANMLTGRWRQIDPPGEPGDVVAMAMSRGRPMHHVGVVLDEGVLHAWCGISRRGGGVMLTPWGHLREFFPVHEVWSTWPS